MNFSTLNAFITVARQKSLTAAATQLNISQPALSRTIHQLEKELGFSLFEHFQNKIVLNSNGEKFLETASAILRQYQNCIYSIRENNGIYSKQLTLAFSSAGIHIPSIIQAFKKSNPDTQFVLKSFHRDVPDPDIDFGFLSSVLKKNPVDGLFLAEEPLYITMSPENPLARNQSLNMSDLSKEHFLFPDSDNDMYDILNYYCSCAGFTPIAANRIEKQNIMVMLLELNGGITLLPHLDNPKLVQLPLKDINCSRFIYLVRNKKNFETLLAKKFEKFCVEFMS